MLVLRKRKEGKASYGYKIPSSSISALIVDKAVTKNHVRELL
jgi:hypothetical protein